MCNACGLYFKLHGINRPSHLFRTAPMTRRRNPKKKKEDAFCKILPATNSKQSGIPDLESGSLEQLDQSGKYIIAQQYDLSIYIPWLFPPVCGVADNTKETTKAYIYISTFYILIYIFGFKFLKKNKTLYKGILQIGVFLYDSANYQHTAIYQFMSTLHFVIFVQNTMYYIWIKRKFSHLYDKTYFNLISHDF